MTQAAAKQSPLDTETDLVLTRIVNVPREKLFKAWTSPETYKDWFAPRPWKTVKANVEFKPGGIFEVVMQSPEGKNMDGEPGCILEVIPNEKLVWTADLGPGYRPNKQTFFTAVLTFEDAEGGTRYTATALHKDAAQRKVHEDMGFHEGWGQCLDQLVEVAKKL